MTFQLPVMEDKVKPHQVTGLHVLSAFVITGTGALFYLLYDAVRWAGAAMMAAGVILIILSLFMNKWVTSPYRNKGFRIAELAILAGAAGYLALQHRWIPTAVPGSMAAAVLFALWWEGAAAGALMVQVGNDGIRLPLSSRKRFVHWHEVEQVLLRYGILTIDCHNNRLFQYRVEPDGIDKEEFEQYCSTNVAANIDKRVADW